MPKYVKVKFIKTAINTYSYEIPETLKIERLVIGEAIVVPVGNDMDLKVAYIVGVSDESNVRPSIKIKKAYGLVRKI